MRINPKVVEAVTQNIINSLEQGEANWRKPWEASFQVSRNGETKHVFRGSNFLFATLFNPWSSPMYFTKASLARLAKDFEVPQIRIRKEEFKNPMRILAPIMGKEEVKDEKTGEVEVKTFPVGYRYIPEWNADQIEWPEGVLEALKQNNKLRDDEAQIEFAPIAKVEAILDGMPNPPQINHGGDRACYVLGLDHINLPHPETFESVESYYAARIHETLHSIKDKSRLGRRNDESIEEEITTSADYHEYGFEELVAEIGSAMLCKMLGIQNLAIGENTVAYCQNWLKAFNVKIKDVKTGEVKTNREWIILAATEAQKRVDYILGGSK